MTAILALAPSIKATNEESAAAVACVVTFGTLAMLSYPYLAHALLATPQQVHVPDLMSLTSRWVSFSASPSTILRKSWGLP